MKTIQTFDDIRPYGNDEVTSVIQRLFENPRLREYMTRFFPEIEWESFKSRTLPIENVDDLQLKIVKPLAAALIEKNSTSLTGTGFENISKDAPCLYISNHRDIILDASILSILLVDNGFVMPEIAIGDNLMLSPWIEDIVRLNKSFIVKRGVSGRRMFEVSRHLSQYIHFAVKSKKESVWIAQREGRAKDSNDRTQDSLLKMLAMGGDKDFLENIRELNIIPVSLSYEYDPCDFLKAKEFQQKRDNPEFKKSRLDDLTSMQTGLSGFKGNIHFKIGKPLNTMLLEWWSTYLNRNELASLIAQLIDDEIFLNYRLYPGNYIAYDYLWGKGRRGNKDFSLEKYTAEDREIFDEYIIKQVNKIDLPDKDTPFLIRKMLEMYANPALNYLSAK
ncbi:MAG: 1-acyl-sn-glycerol-3-phosphate acyltransferase [Dysgonamonadaceae bacterium]|jgi:hypothetical protein|nr:1-acyl-sn-glycerol-3-phosphate acyltransferase [Dysgonamonadaceae bacterium]